MGYICNCFFEQNIYLKEYNIHVVFNGNVTEFRQHYSQFLLSKGCDEDDIVNMVQQEVRRRKDMFHKSIERKQQILDCYNRLHPELFNFKETYLHQHFITIANHTRSKSANLESLLAIPGMARHSASQVYILPVFTKTLCERLVEELDAFNLSDVPKGRPNTMNNFGVLLDELGLEEGFLDTLVDNYIKPITEILYPDDGGRSLDSYKAFTVKYKTGEDLDLGYHFDNAEVTLNVCLGTNFTGGNLYFGAMKQEQIEDGKCTEMRHRVGYGCLHRGQHMHGALPIQSGVRHNMILWMRSSQTRNKCCPMCSKSPKIVEVNGKGDGFKPKVVQVCTTI